MTMLTAENIMLAAKGPETVEVDVPEWGGPVKVRGFSRAEVKALRKRCTTVTTSGGQRSEDIDTDLLEREMFLEGLVEPKLSRDHWEALQAKAAGGIETVLKAITAASGLTKAEGAEMKSAFPAAEGEVV